MVRAGASLIVAGVAAVIELATVVAIVPLVMFTADRRKMGELVSPLWLTALAIIVAAIVIALNIKVLSDLLIG